MMIRHSYPGFRDRWGSPGHGNSWPTISSKFKKVVGRTSNALMKCVSHLVSYSSGGQTNEEWMNYALTVVNNIHARREGLLFSLNDPSIKILVSQWGRRLQNEVDYVLSYNPDDLFGSGGDSSDEESDNYVLFGSVSSDKDSIRTGSDPNTLQLFTTKNHLNPINILPFYVIPRSFTHFLLQFRDTEQGMNITDVYEDLLYVAEFQFLYWQEEGREQDYLPKLVAWNSVAYLRMLSSFEYFLQAAQSETNRDSIFGFTLASIPSSQNAQLMAEAGQQNGIHLLGG
jgi:hypothetical protein